MRTHLVEELFYKPEVVTKAWGSETIIRNSNLYCGKLLQYYVGWASSQHHHVEKEETFFVLDGQFDVSLWTPEGRDYAKIVTAEECIHIPRGWSHRVRCIKTGTLMEVSTPHSDNDVFRVDPSGKFV